MRPAEGRVLGVVDAAVAPGIAAEEAPGGVRAAFHEPVEAKRIDRVLRAARVVLAGAGGREQAECVPPRVDETGPGGAGDPPAAAWPSTSRPCSTSHTWPWACAASARPGRATST